MNILRQKMGLFLERLHVRRNKRQELLNLVLLFSETFARPKNRIESRLRKRIGAVVGLRQDGKLGLHTGHQQPIRRGLQAFVIIRRELCLRPANLAGDRRHRHRLVLVVVSLSGLSSVVGQKMVS